MDKLTMDCAKAKAAGLSYGQWRALQKPEKVEKGIPEGWRVCAYCGKPYKPTTRRPQLYCEIYCRERASWERKNKQRTVEKNGQAKDDRNEQALCAEQQSGSEEI